MPASVLDVFRWPPAARNSPRSAPRWTSASSFASRDKVQSLLSQHGIPYAQHGAFSDEGSAFLDEIDLYEVGRTLLDVWLDTIDDLLEKISRLDAEITERGAAAEDMQRSMEAPGIAAFSAMLITAEIGDVDRSAGAKSVVSYAGLAPPVQESGDVQTERTITKNGSPYLRWILVECAQTAVHVSKDPYGCSAHHSA